MARRNPQDPGVDGGVARSAPEGIAAAAGGRSDEPATCLVPPGCAWPIVLGIDPGTRLVGYGALVVAPDRPRLLAAGTIRAGGREAVALRLDRIRREIDALLVRCRPAEVVVERAFAARNVQAALRLGEARGVILACAASFGARVGELSPSEAKRAVIGNGGASKEQVARTVANWLGLSEPPGSLDTTDALALALAWVRRSEWASRVADRG